MAKMRPPGPINPRATTSWVQYTSEWAMTSTVMSIWARVATSFASAPTISLSVPKASECSSTRSVPIPPLSFSVRSMAATTSPRLASSAAFTLKKSARRPRASIDATTRSALGSVARRSRWTPKTSRPAPASAVAVAPPKPEEAPSTSAQPERRIGEGSAMRRRAFYRRIPHGMPKTAGIILVGNEILSGKAEDANAVYLFRERRPLGVDVRRISVIPDEVQLIADEVATFSRDYDVVFTSGGVGPTHDDVTIEGVARAMLVPVVRHRRLVELLERYYRGKVTEAALRMAEIPDGAELVGGETVRFPTVLMRNVYILPRVPEIFRAKFEALRERFRDAPIHLRNVFVTLGEGTLAEHLNGLLADFPSLLLGSYPELSNPEYKVKVTLESRDQSYLEGALAELLRRLPAEALVKVT